VIRPKDLFDLLRQAIRRYGLRLLIFDNIHALARSVDHRSEEISVLSKQFKALAMEMEIPILLIAQPRKLIPGVVMTPWDFKDSVDLYSDSDQMIILHRETTGKAKGKDAVAEADGEQDTKSPFTLVRIAKARRVAERDVSLYFEGSQHRFREVTPMEKITEVK
jgi:replicative DNA helicase